MNAEILTIGDTTLNTFLFVDDVALREEEGRVLACVNWGDKLPVKHVEITFGGNAANVAIGASRLGIRTGIWTILGTDDSGQMIAKDFRKEHVLLDLVEFQGSQTNLSTVLSFQGERTIFQYHAERDYVLPGEISAQWIYLTSMNEGFQKSFPELVKLVEKNFVKLFYNPGTFQLKAGLQDSLEILKCSELVIVNLEEARRWLGEKPVEDLLREFKKLGPKKVVITDGRKGAFGLDETGSGYYLPEFSGDRLEATGAGDSFGCGLISGLYLGRSFVDSMKLGAVEAASVVSKVGAQAGLLTLSECDAKLKLAPDFEAKQIF